MVLELVEEGIYLIPFLRQEVKGYLLSQMEELLKHGREAIEQDKQLSTADKAGAVALQFTMPSSKIYRVPNNVKIKSCKLTAKLVDKLQPVQEGNYVIQLTPKDMEKFHGDLKNFFGVRKNSYRGLLVMMTSDA